MRLARPDLVLLDLMLPGQDGLAVCRELRSFTTPPIIMVTARVEEIDRLLALLAASPGRVYSRDRLLDRLYDDGRVVLDRTVDTHVKNLRRKLGEIAPGVELIHPVYGVGFKLELPALSPP